MSSDNLENLRDRIPHAFPRPPAPRKRGNGSKKAAAWARRFAFYRYMFRDLVFGAHKRDQANQLAQTGGIEASP